MDRKKIIKTIIGILIICIIVLVGVSVYKYSRAYKERFLPGTTIGGIDVSELLPEEGIKKAKENYELTIKFREGKKETIIGRDIDIRFKDEEKIKEKIKENSYIEYVKTLFTHKENPLEVQGIFDENRLKKRINTLPQLKKENMKPAKNPTIVYKNGDFTVADKENGTIIDKAVFIPVVISSVKSLNKDLDVSKDRNVYKDEFKKVDISKLKEDCKVLSEMKWSIVKYKLPGGKEKILDPNITQKWLKRNDSGRLEKQDEYWKKKANAFVKELSSSVNTVYKRHKFKTRDGKVISLPPTWYYGWRIDEEKELGKLLKDLKSNKTVNREPVFAQREKADYSDNFGFGKTYIEINLTDQHLWYYKNGKTVFQTDLVSGTQGSHPTHPGSFFILDKGRNVTLRGPEKIETTKKVIKDGDKKKIIKKSKKVYEWESPVSYWMPIDYEGTGLHDANWRGAFGGDIWKYSGSHGCINLPPSKAGQLYNMIKVGTPVAIYY